MIRLTSYRRNEVKYTFYVLVYNSFVCVEITTNYVFTKIIITRLEKKLDENQPREQASKTDHIHAINQLKETCREYNIQLCVAFVDYEKAFDSVQTQAILTSLKEQ